MAKDVENGFYDTMKPLDFIKCYKEFYVSEKAGIAFAIVYVEPVRVKGEN